ncbi:hypothetical protein IEU95_01965 [Hoyosella rhizosphaerae]|uniref:Uncharacterized protein n=1 Tax=Hoyosella rhizosphaerae TaxID=1755582 RepID=A0A916UE90_9ACTN|nr:hypothetical protein [Hoyosella rhizosphaerae]MBN4925579.1 hypothetical protein [Hoyosella rhizosphaerae]GGC69550.1 hypothetical protein GCM10011410_22950 [Hoyosella rhizosphaerae]
MSSAVMYLLFMAAGFLLGGAIALWKTHRFFSGVLAAVAVIAGAGAVLNLMEVI